MVITAASGAPGESRLYFARCFRLQHEGVTLLRDQLIGMQTSAELSGLINQTLEDDRGKTLWTLVAAMAGFVLVLTLFGIYYTHKVAGPLYKMSSLFGRVRDNYLGTAPPGLRKGDELHDFYLSFREMHQAMRERNEGRRIAARVRNQPHGDTPGDQGDEQDCRAAARACG